jgi:hypothetical protein
MSSGRQVQLPERPDQREERRIEFKYKSKEVNSAVPKEKANS